MTKTIWKLNIAAERLWNTASALASQAAKFEMYGTGFAVLAEETRRVSLQIGSYAEKVLFEQESENMKFIADMAKHLSLLSVNTAIEALANGNSGKGAAIAAEEIGNISRDIIELSGAEQHAGCISHPFPKKPLTSLKENQAFLLFTAAGYSMVENLSFVNEFLLSADTSDSTHIIHRNGKIRIIDCFALLGENCDNPSYAIIKTPWAKTDETYAVAVDTLSVSSIFYSPLGHPVSPAPDMLMREYVREYWDGEDGEVFRFMDWGKMAGM
ncbi:MAG: hypothetical protein LBS21_12105 [Clostridiales bacterium]|jgi:hypothetical protein|nr:hypothetical protein [Clostridiales bacterium]